MTQQQYTNKSFYYNISAKRMPNKICNQNRRIKVCTFNSKFNFKSKKKYYYNKQLFANMSAEEF